MGAMLASASEPSQVISDGQEISIVGSISSDKTFGTSNGKTSERSFYRLKPKAFIATNPNQKFGTSFEIQIDDPSLTSSVDDLSTYDVSARCRVAVPAHSWQLPTCHLLSISRYQEPNAPSKYELAAQREREAIRAKSFDRSTVGKMALVFSAAPPGAAKIPRSEMVSVLYLTSPCELPIEHAKSMLRAELSIGQGMVSGCWGAALSPTKDKVIQVTEFGEITTNSLTSFVRAKITQDGSAEVIGPAMSMEEYFRNVRNYQQKFN